MSPHILIVDDSTVTLRVMGAFLSPLGKTHGAPDIEAGLQLAREVDFDLIVADYQLRGEGHGIDFIRAARALENHAQTPAVLVSSSLDRVLVTQAYLAGVNLCMVKPIDRTQFVENCRRLLEHPFVEVPETLAASVPCVRWSQAERHWQFCPETQHLVSGDTAEAAETAMQRALAEHYASHPGLGALQRIQPHFHFLQRPRESFSIRA